MDYEKYPAEGARSPLPNVSRRWNNTDCHAVPKASREPLKLKVSLWCSPRNKEQESASRCLLLTVTMTLRSSCTATAALTIPTSLPDKVLPRDAKLLSPMTEVPAQAHLPHEAPYSMPRIHCDFPKTINSSYAFTLTPKFILLLPLSVLCMFIVLSP